MFSTTCTMLALIKSTNKIGAIIIIFFGGIASLWANCILVTNLKNKMRSDEFLSLGYDEYNNILWTIQLTYLAFFIIASGTLLWAFKKSQKKFLVPWSLLKFSENILLVIGSITLYYKWSFYGLFPLGIISVVINVYISLSVYKAYKKMESIQLIKEYENDLKEVSQEITIGKIDKESQTDATNVIIEIKKKTHNNENNPFNYIHTHVSNTS